MTINPFLLSSTQRLEHWKQFRSSLASLPPPEQPCACAAYWAKAPLMNIAYDCDDPDTWPTIWEMVQAGDWCRNSVAIGMEGTLRLAGFDPDRLSLGLLWDQDIAAMVLVVRVAPPAAATASEVPVLLNYEWALPAAMPQTRHRWLRRFRWTGRRYAQF